MPIVPNPPLVNTNALSNEVELATQRNLTWWFIKQDPNIIVLQTRVKARTSSGAVSTILGPPRAAQTFKLIDSGNSGLIDSIDGSEKDYSLTLLGAWDAQVKVGDWWQDIYGSYFEVEQMLSYNGYEVRALVRSYGENPHA